MSPVARALIIAGVVLIVAGLAWQFGGKYLSFLGRLPGDIAYERKNVRVYFPIVTSILLSIVLSLLAWLWNKFGR